MFDNIGTGELLIISVVVLLLFGSKKLPEFAHGLGKGIREFRKSLKDVEDEIKITPDKEEKSSKK
ncbi:MAG: Sec-independent protein translocase subunit TatA/TatB [Ignavibacteriaceae bacterium]